MVVAERTSLDWRSLAAKITAPPKKVVVAMLPKVEGDIKLADFRRFTHDETAESKAFAEFAMPRVKKFFERPQYRDMDGLQRQHVMARILEELKGEFKEEYHKPVKGQGGTKIRHEDLGVVIASCEDGPEPGSTVACHPEDGSRLEAFGQDLAVFGAFLPEMEWEPQYCPWWESIQAEVDMEQGQLRAYGNKIVIQLDPQKEKHGDIWIPDVAQRWDADATIVSVGKLQTDVQPEERWSVDMNLVTNAGLEFALGPQFERMFVIPPEALNFRYADN